MLHFPVVSGLVAQSVEQRPLKAMVVGSIPTRPTTLHSIDHKTVSLDGVFLFSIHNGT